MPLLEDVKLDVIRHLDYPVMGLYSQSQSGGALAYGGAGWRYFGGYGTLLYRLNMLRPVEEAKLTGLATSSVFFTGLGPTPGDSITITLSAAGLASPIVITVTVPTNQPGVAPWNLLTVAANIAQAFVLTPAFLAAGFYAVADYGGNPFSALQQAPVAICSINAPAAFGTFTLSATFTGSTAPQISGAGKPVAPYLNFIAPTGLVVLNGYIPILNFLESGIGGAATHLGTLIANNVTLRHDELEQREDQFDYFVKKMSRYLEIPRCRDNEGCGMRVSY